MAKKLRLGAVVRVISRPPLDDKLPYWAEPYMDRYCGRVSVVDALLDEGFPQLRDFRDGSHWWYWHRDWLLPATKCRLALDRCK